ncbi:PIG-L family deacetylase [Candidatus Saccharibacteria bacterium]|nr:PIG-L family deacetylase [Candidatus Saccharibacteria bacterium]
MKPLNTVDDIKSLGTILGVWAHPDDETFSMGGIMAAAVGNGQKVSCVTATRGEAGVQDESRWPAARLGEIRTAELRASMEILGVTDHCWLDYPDGKCNVVPTEDGVGRIADCINRCQPDTILTFGPDGMTGHPDHQTVSDWAKRAMEYTGSQANLYYAVQTHAQYDAMIEADKQFNIFFNIDKPPTCESGQCSVCFELDDNLYLCKIAALKAMPSQTESIMQFFEDSLRTSLGTEAFVKA